MSSGARRLPGGDTLLLLVGVAALVAGWVWLASPRGEIRQSVIGFDALAEWLRQDGIDARTFTGGTYRDPGSIGLRLLPLYDTDPTRAGAPSDTRARARENADLVDIPAWVLRSKLDIPTLLILPKWRGAVPASGRMHPAFANDTAAVSRGYAKALRMPLTLRRTEGGFVGFRPPEGDFDLEIYAPQLVEAPDCTPLIGTERGMLLGRCETKRSTFLLLSDPDLMSNAGLALGDNAAFARWFLSEAAGSGTVLIDYSTDIWMSDGAGEDLRERTAQDLERYFAWPFSLLWAAAAGLALLALWRGAVRAGPPLRTGRRFGRGTGLEAQSRLMRLTGHDGDLLRAHAAARLQALAADLFGPHRGSGDALAQVRERVARRDTGLATRLSAAADAVATCPGRPAPTEALARLERFETIIEEIRHELGAAIRPR
ncbi:hypothetical protein FDP22_04185 [Paroceanicella profunda]|uniref:DUF4350 domain-containing protein n=1 Tax=Paroceanicella profunda TaxID=2579971 RepID=A0A5B8FY50_9RHOB|nr:hypothetical protein [Paroceanicella profunda]QDL91053.1 hypothetical protein FDP22_04185 [Paroceanicella profunda]